MNKSNPRATSDNNRKEDAHLLYFMVFASSCFAAPAELRTFIASKRDDFFAVDVIRNGNLIGMYFGGMFLEP